MENEPNPKYIVTSNDGDFVYIKPEDDFIELHSEPDNDIDTEKVITIWRDDLLRLIKILQGLL
jgi:hypothetical protein